MMKSNSLSGCFRPLHITIKMVKMSSCWMYEVLCFLIEDCIGLLTHFCYVFSDNEKSRVQSYYHLELINFCTGWSGGTIGMDRDHKWNEAKTIIFWWVRKHLPVLWIVITGNGKAWDSHIKSKINYRNEFF